MNKKIVIPIIIILLLIIGGVFLWWKEIPKKKIIYERTFVNGKNYEVIDTAEGKIIENKKEGFAARIPEGWIVKKYEEEIGLFSPEAEFDQYGAFLKSVREKRVCVIGITIVKSKKVDPEITTDAEDLNALIVEVQENPIETETEKYEVITVGNRLALKRTSLKEGEEKYVSVEIPVNNTVYSFEGGIILSEKCVQEFNKFLGTVSINK